MSAGSLCSSVRYGWLGRSSSHGECDSTQNCDPEADQWERPLIGGTGATRVGTFVDPSPACGGDSLLICKVTEGLEGQVRLIRRSSYYNDVCMTWIQCSARTHSVLQRHESLSASYVEALCPSTNRHETYKGY